MEWENKVEMIRLLNNGLYEEAVKMFGEEKDWDEQAIEMFILGFDLNRRELLEPIKDRILSVQSSDFRTAMRLSVIYNHFRP